MTLALYMDKDSLDRAVIAELRRLGLAILTTTEADNDRLSDTEQLVFATSLGRAIFTSNVRDFARLHASWLSTGRSHAGIIARFRQRMPIGQQVQAMLALSAASDQTSFENGFEYLERWRPRR